MKKSYPGATHSRALRPHPRAEVTSDWVAVLRGAHPQSTAKHVAARIGAPVATVKKWLAGESEPCFGATLALIGAYGFDFLKPCLPGVPWISAAAAQAQRERLHAEILAVDAELAALDAPVRRPPFANGR